MTALITSLNNDQIAPALEKAHALPEAAEVQSAVNKTGNLPEDTTQVLQNLDSKASAAKAFTDTLGQSATAENIIESKIESERISTLSPVATVTTLASAKLLAKNSMKVSERVRTLSYHSDMDLGGNTYILLDASPNPRPADNGGQIIHVGSDGLYLKGLFEDAIYRLTQFGGGRGNQAEDSAAAQQMIDANLQHCFFESNENEYELSSLTVPANQVFLLKGQNQFNAKIACRGKVITYGDINVTSSLGVVAENLSFIVYTDLIDGVIDFQFCRNIVMRDVFVTDNDTGAKIGYFAKLDRSYQVDFTAVYGRWYGGALFELGDSAASEVLDTISLNKTVWHGNYGMFVREGAKNIHNLVLNNAKFRDRRASPEHTNANQGLTVVSNGLSAGDTVINVADASQLMQGNLSANNLIYIGFGYVAEQVRVASASGNQITLDTPLRFSHSAAEPVIFGPVYLTLQNVYSFVQNCAHYERGFIAIHADDCQGASVNNTFSTCLNTFTITDKCRNWIIGPVTLGGVGWVRDVNILHVPSYHDANNPIRNINIIAGVEADSGVTYRYLSNQSTQASDGIASYKANSSQSVNRSLTTTINTDLISHAVVSMNGRIDTLNISDGRVPGQLLTVTFLQDSNGYRFVNTVSENVNLSSPIALSYKQSAPDEYIFKWDGEQWRDIKRTVEDYQSPRRVTGDISNATHEVNAHNKETNKPIRRGSTGQLLYAMGPNPTDGWIDSNGNQVVTVS